MLGISILPLNDFIVELGCDIDIIENKLKIMELISFQIIADLAD
jgi:hypothetical protein